MQLATTLRSIVESNKGGGPFEFHVFSDGFSEAAQKRVANSLPAGAASIRWEFVDLRRFAQFATAPHVSRMTFCRFLIPSLFPATVSRVLYLDADLLVLDDLRLLWETDLNGAVVGSVLDGLNAQLEEGRPGLEAVPRVRAYFNAGVLLIDLVRWRQERISERALEYLNLHPRTPLADQDALNAVCDGRWKALDPRWNFQDHYERRKVSVMAPDERPGIVHFVYKHKPWDFSVPTLNAGLYDDFRSRTAFARTPAHKLWNAVQDRRYRLTNAVLWEETRSGWHQVRAFLKRFVFLRTAVAVLRRLR